MLEFVLSYYFIFIIIGIVLLLGLFGYMMDRKKYDQYRNEIINSEYAIQSLENSAEVSNIATPMQVEESPVEEVQEEIVATEDVVMDDTPFDANSGYTDDATQTLDLSQINTDDQDKNVVIPDNDPITGSIQQ